MKEYTIIAGVNGAGKSSLYDNMSITDKIKLGNRINADEIQVNENKSLIEASQIAVKQLTQYLKGNTSFHQETTFAGRGNIGNIIKAKDNGFYISLYYIGLQNKELAIERVKKRVMQGGHDVPTNIIEKRYASSLKNLKECIPYFDEIKIYDNTQVPKLIYYKKNGKLLHKDDNLPFWFKDTFNISDKKPSLKEQIREASKKSSQNINNNFNKGKSKDIER